MVYTAETPAGDSDIWSADAAGQDRRNLTARPGLSEEAPAFSPDGTMIAYAAQQPEGGRRIVVADSDGRGPRILAPPGTRGGDDDSDPAWSPDGTQLAFTRSDADGSGRVLLLRVADARPARRGADAAAPRRHGPGAGLVARRRPAGAAPAARSPGRASSTGR